MEKGGIQTQTLEQWIGEIKKKLLSHIHVFYSREKNFSKWGRNEIWSLAETGHSESLDSQRNIGEENDIFNVSWDDV